MSGLIRAGSLDRRVELIRRGPGVDNGYEVLPGDWQLIGTRAASVKPVKRKEAEEGDARVARREVSVWLRFDSLTRTLLPTDALVFEGRLYELVADPVEVGRREGIELMAVASDKPFDPDANLPPWVGGGLAEGDGITIVGNSVRLDIDELPLAP